MKESYVEGLASYGGPESCVHAREGVGEALTGVRAGRVSSRVIHAPRRELRVVRGAEAVGESRRPHRCCRYGEAASDPARWEIPRPSAQRWEAPGAERIVKPKGVRR